MNGRRDDAAADLRRALEILDPERDDAWIKEITADLAQLGEELP